METGRFSPVYVKLSPEDIVAIKFIIESYEGLGIVRTLNADTGELVIMCTEDTAPEVVKIVDQLRCSLNLRIIPRPPSAAADWLLAEEE